MPPTFLFEALTRVVQEKSTTKYPTDLSIGKERIQGKVFYLPKFSVALFPRKKGDIHLYGSSPHVAY
jgi:hypothetical protein